MNLAIVHYHLNRGGVTRVIEYHLAALDAVLEGAEPWNVAILYGGRQRGWNEALAEQLRNVRLSLVEIPRLDYDDCQDNAEQCSPADLLMELYAALGQVGFAPEPTVLHVHNHSLGKNRSLAEVVPVLAQDGYAVLLQTHDFAEDFRPDNYRLLAEPAEVYPQAAGIHYAVLNGRDHGILHAAGVPTERLHLLPNPVPELDDLPSRADARDRLQQCFGVGKDDCFVLYPVRGIRRKNLGELVLYSALAPPGTVVGVTLVPRNPVEVPFHEGWKEFAGKLQLPCLFGLGESGGLQFGENLVAADLMISTSVAEGFGMVFLESWLAGRPLIGRDLPEITPDFTAQGVQLDWLRPQLRLPVEWVGEAAFRRTIADAYRRTLESYAHAEPPDLDEQIGAKIVDGLVDFADLDEPLQRKVIETVCREPHHRVLDANPGLREAFAVRTETAADVIGQNRETIERHFSPRRSGRRLLELYERVAASNRDELPQPLAHSERILDAFLDVRRFRPIRS